MITPYLSQQPIDDFGFRFTELKYSALLAAATEATLTIPGNAPRYKAIMKSLPGSGNVWIAINETAVVPIAPVGNVLNATSSELLNGFCLCREVKAGDVLHFIAVSANTPFSVVLYALNTNN
jgi:hypothetical protein